MNVLPHAARAVLENLPHSFSNPYVIEGKLFALPICLPPPRKSRHPRIGTGEAKRHKISIQLLHCAPFLARLPGLGRHTPVHRPSASIGVAGDRHRPLGMKAGTSLGAGLIDHIQKMTIAAMVMADMKVWAHLS